MTIKIRDRHLRKAGISIDGTFYPHFDSFRARLRHETSSEHQALEALAGVPDFTCSDHVDRFLVAQAAGFSALETNRVGRPLREEGSLMGEILTTLAEDCARRGLRVPRLCRRRPIRSDAVAYLVIGSRLGTEVLRRSAERAGVVPPSYFQLGVPVAAWRAFCERLDGVDVHGSLADGIIASCREGFDLFREAVERVADLPLRGDAPL